MRGRIQGLVVLMAVAMATPAAARVLDGRDADRLANDSAEEFLRRDNAMQSIAVLLESQGMQEEQLQKVQEKITRRLIAGIRATAYSFEGESFDTYEQAKEAVVRRSRIFQFNAMSNPIAYAENRPTKFQMTAPEIARMEKTLLATYIEKEPILREKLSEMVLMEDLKASDVASIRALARERVVAKGKETLQAMRGASFFSAFDAAYFLETAIEGEIDTIRSEKLSDPTILPVFLEEARTRFPVEIETSEAPAPASGRVAGLRR